MRIAANQFLTKFSAVVHLYKAPSLSQMRVEVACQFAGDAY